MVAVVADPCVCPARQATIRTDSRTRRDDEAPNSSLLFILEISIMIAPKKTKLQEINCIRKKTAKYMQICQILFRL